jgi:hypothetical protein
MLTIAPVAVAVPRVALPQPTASLLTVAPEDEIVTILPTEPSAKDGYELLFASR